MNKLILTGISLFSLIIYYYRKKIKILLLQIILIKYVLVITV